MKSSVIKSYDELPMFLSAMDVAALLGISRSSAYELMHEKGFPSVRIGSRFIVPKANLQTWIDEQIQKKNGVC